MSNVIEQFAREHLDYNAVTPRRRAAVLRVLHTFEAFVPCAVLDVTEKELADYLRHRLLNDRCAANTVRFEAGCIRPFLRWAWRTGKIDADRWMRLADVPNPRGSTNMATPRPYDRKELDRFWQEFDARWPLNTRPSTIVRWQQGVAKWPRMYRHAMHVQLECIFGLALYCGLRREEIFDLSIDDFHYDNEYVVVQSGKGGKYREVPHTDASRSAAHGWIELRTLVMRTHTKGRPRRFTKHDRPWVSLAPTATKNSIMPSDYRNPMSRRRFDSLPSTIGAWEYHRFRHTCATEWLRAGMPLEQVQRLLGHSSITQTLGYAQIVGGDVMRAAAQHGRSFDEAVGRRAA